MAKVKNDKSLQQQLQGATDANAVAAIAKAAGWDFTGAELEQHYEIRKPLSFAAFNNE